MKNKQCEIYFIDFRHPQRIGTPFMYRRGKKNSRNAKNSFFWKNYAPSSDKEMKELRDYLKYCIKSVYGVEE